MEHEVKITDPIDYIGGNRGTILKDIVENDYIISPIGSVKKGPETIVIPDGVYKIGNSLFCNCTWLKHIIIPNSVRSIGHGSFAASGITNCVIPEGVEEVQSGAFFNSRLKSIYLPQSLKGLFRHGSPFTACRMEEMYLASKAPDFVLCHMDGLKDIFDLWAFDIRNCVIYVPTESLNLYQKHWAFKEFKKIVPIERDMLTEYYIKRQE